MSVQNPVGDASVKVFSQYTRSIPDPNFEAEVYIFVMRCKDLPDGISDAPNARSVNLRRGVYGQVCSSLLEKDETPKGTFHLKNSGITIVAKSVERLGDGFFFLNMEEDLHGIVDGGHTYALICENRRKIPNDQFIMVRVFSRLDEEWIPMISRGLNTSIQVQDMSLDNLAGKFEWIKDALGDKKSLISWTENDTSGVMDARDLVSILCLFNASLYPNDNEVHPVDAYNGKAKILSAYEKKVESYQKLGGIVLEILDLHDYISSTANEVWGQKPHAKSPKLNMIETLKKASRPSFCFDKKLSKYRLIKPVLYPILNAFRRFVTAEKNGNLIWISDYKDIRKFWKSEGRALLEICYSHTVEFRNNISLVGKNASLWTILHDKVGLRLYKSGVLKPSSDGF